MRTVTGILSSDHTASTVTKRKLQQMPREKETCGHRETRVGPLHFLLSALVRWKEEKLGNDTEDLNFIKNIVLTDKANKASFLSPMRQSQKLTQGRV